MSRLATAARTLVAWLVGLTVAGAWWLHFTPWFGLPESPLLRIAVVACLVATLAAARVAVVPRAGALEVGAVLCFACVPVLLAQILAPGLGDVPAWATRFTNPSFLRRAAQQELVLHVVPMEAASLACLVSGAMGLSRVTWARALLSPVAWVGGASIGFEALESEGVVLGVVVGVALLVIAGTGRPTANRVTSSRSARGLAVLAVAMAVGMAVDIPWLFRRTATLGPYPYDDLWSVTESFVHAHRVMLVRLAGCGVLLSFFALRGRRRARSRSHPSDAVVAMVGLVCLVGSAVHLRHLRVRLLDRQWERASMQRDCPFPCSCHYFGVDRSGLMSIGEPLEPIELPWPMSAQIDPRYRLGFVTTRVAIDGSDAPAERMELDGTEAFGPFLRELSERRGPAPTVVFDAPESAP